MVGGDEEVGNGGLEGVVNLLDMDGCLVYLWVSDKFHGKSSSNLIDLWKRYISVAVFLLMRWMEWDYEKIPFP